MADLHIWFNGYDFVIADSIDDARAVCREQHGQDMDPEDIDAEGWRMWPDDKPVTERGGEVDLPDVTRPARELVAERGRCYMGSTES